MLLYQIKYITYKQAMYQGLLTLPLHPTISTHSPNIHISYPLF